MAIFVFLNIFSGIFPLRVERGEQERLMGNMKKEVILFVGRERSIKMWWGEGEDNGEVITKNNLMYVLKCHNATFLYVNQKLILKYKDKIFRNGVG